MYYIIIFGVLIKSYLFCNIDDKCQIPYIKNGNYSIINNLEIKFYCNKNFVLHGKEINQCLCNIWISPFPTCQMRINSVPECSAPFVQKGWVECLTVGCNRFYVGTEAAIRCERGYQLVGNSRLHCRIQNELSWRKATWSSPVPKCVLIDGEYPEVSQDSTSLNIFYNENSSVMIIIIILSVLACGLMLLISAMIMNRLVKRRRMIRFQRSDNTMVNGPATITTSNDIEDHCATIQAEQNTSARETNRWNCFSRNNTHYQHMDSHTAENITSAEQDSTPVETPELYNHLIYSDDRTSLINPPCYEEAIKCSQYSIVVSSHANLALNSKGNKKSKHGSSKASKREKLKHLPIRSVIPSTTEVPNVNQPDSSLQSAVVVSQSIVENNNCAQSSVGPRSNDVDNISRRSARVHYSRVVNNISAESNNSFLSGSIETMAVSDGTSVTVHTFDSMGSDPSIGSMRPQTGSIGDPTYFNNNRQSSSRYTNNNTAESDFPDIQSSQRYSPPPSYDSSMKNQIVLKSGRSCRSNTASPSASSNIALFVDNMATVNDSTDIPT